VSQERDIMTVGVTLADPTLTDPLTGHTYSADRGQLM
jgi:hypothetical protein